MWAQGKIGKTWWACSLEHGRNVDYEEFVGRESFLHSFLEYLKCPEVLL